MPLTPCLPLAIIVHCQHVLIAGGNGVQVWLNCLAIRRAMIAEYRSEAVRKQFEEFQLSGLMLGPALGGHLGQYGVEFACLVHVVLASIAAGLAVWLQHQRYQQQQQQQQQQRHRRRRRRHSSAGADGRTQVSSHQRLGAMSKVTHASTQAVVGPVSELRGVLRAPPVLGLLLSLFFLAFGTYSAACGYFRFVKLRFGFGFVEFGWLLSANLLVSVISFASVKSMLERGSADPPKLLCAASACMMCAALAHLILIKARTVPMLLAAMVMATMASGGAYCVLAYGTASFAHLLRPTD
jgi:hypothetical protein